MDIIWTPSQDSKPSPYIIGCDPIGPDPSKYHTILSKWGEETQQYIPIPTTWLKSK